MARLAGSAAVLGALALAGATPAGAATLHVDITQDVQAGDNHCSLREAVASANTDMRSGLQGGECDAGDAAPVSDTIVLGAGTYLLTADDGGAPHTGEVGNGEDDLNVTASLEIKGQGPASTIIDAHLIHDRAIHIEPPSGAIAVTIDGVRFTGGRSEEATSSHTNAADGGAIYSAEADLSLSNCRFDGNRTGSGVTETFPRGSAATNTGGSGGALFVVGAARALHIDGCTFENNETGRGGNGFSYLSGSGRGGPGGRGGNGGAIYTGPLQAFTISKSSFTGNFTEHGGGGGNAGPAPADPSETGGGSGATAARAARCTRTAFSPAPPSRTSRSPRTSPAPAATAASPPLPVVGEGATAARPAAAGHSRSSGT